MKIIKSFFLFLSIIVLISMNSNAEENSLVVDESGNVGIGTETPSSKLEVDGGLKISGDLEVNGSIKKGGDYADWYVGSYYSIPANQRTAGWDWTIEDLTTSWTTVDFSAKLPQGVKRIKIYADVSGISNKIGSVILKARSVDSTPNSCSMIGKILLQTYMTGKSRI